MWRDRRATLIFSFLALAILAVLVIALVLTSRAHAEEYVLSSPIKIIAATKTPCDGKVYSQLYTGNLHGAWDIFAITLRAKPQTGTGRWEMRVKPDNGAVEPWAEAGGPHAETSRHLSWGPGIYVLPQGVPFKAEFACWGGGTKEFQAVLHFVEPY